MYMSKQVEWSLNGMESFLLLLLQITRAADHWHTSLEYKMGAYGNFSETRKGVTPSKFIMVMPFILGQASLCKI